MSLHQQTHAKADSAMHSTTGLEILITWQQI